MGKRLITIEDLYNVQSVSNPQISPNGREAVCVVAGICKQENTYTSYLCQINLETNEVTRWTFGKERISSPQWSADGKQLAFLSNRTETNQLYVMNSSGGEAKQVTDFVKGVSRFLWSPCGHKIWVNGTVKEGETFTTKAEELPKNNPEPVRVTKMKYKADGKGLLASDEFSQIGTADLQTGEVMQFTKGSHHHSLEAISHDGKHLVIGVNRKENQDHEFSEPLYVIDIETKAETVLVKEEGYYGAVSFSKDDQFIAYIGSDLTYKNATHPTLFVYDRETGIVTNLTESLDAPVGDLIVADHVQDLGPPGAVWTDDNHLYFQLSTMGDVRLYVASLDGAIYPATQEDEHVYGFDVSADGQFAILCISNSTKPGELYKQTIMTGERTQLTTVNKAWLGEVEVVEPEAIQYESGDELVHGWLMKPASYKEGSTYPLIVEIHGGPHTMYGNTFFHELQVLAAEGYGVLYVNPRGSHGYSQRFVDRVRGDYGGGDYEDIMAGLDYVLDQYSWIDRERLGVTGGSYGGFMTNWIVGRTNRFKAAVTQRSISNWISFYGVSDIGYYFSEWQLNADLQDMETLWYRSPLKYVDRIETPLLILHSEKDFRCPIEQAEQLFIALKRQGKETELVRFPDADHNLSRTGLPNLRTARLEELTGWFKRYLV